VVLGERGGSGVCGVERGIECLEGGRREYPALCVTTFRVVREEVLVVCGLPCQAIVLKKMFICPST
jgi:hypothetical protein